MIGRLPEGLHYLDGVLVGPDSRHRGTGKIVNLERFPELSHIPELTTDSQEFIDLFLQGKAIATRLRLPEDGVSRTGVYGSSKQVLKDLGFEIKGVNKDETFFIVELPAGWTYQREGENGYWNTIKDETGRPRIKYVNPFWAPGVRGFHGSDEIELISPTSSPPP